MINTSELYPIIDGFNYEYMISLGAKALKKEFDSTSIMIFTILAIFFVLSSILIYTQTRDKKKYFIYAIPSILVVALVLPVYNKVSYNFLLKKAEIIFKIEYGEELDNDMLTARIAKKKEKEMDYGFTKEIYEKYEKVLQGAYSKMSLVLDIPTEELYAVMKNKEDRNLKTTVSIEELDKEITSFVNDKYYKIER